MRFIKKYLPRSLFTRSLLILMAPIILTQVITTYIFFDRHWDRTASRLASAVAGEVAFISQQYQSKENQEQIDTLVKDSLKHLHLSVQYFEGKKLDPRIAHTHWRERIIQKILSRKLHERLKKPYRILVDREEKWIQVQVALPQGVLMVTSPERRLFSSSGYVFLIWMVGISAILMIVAVLFMRNQVRPIKRLAVAADWFGKGREVPFFRPQGAREVRQAARAFMGMRDRLNRQIQQRTEMLAGVSHDLRTPLTRIKLQLSMFDETDDVKALQQDVDDMERMLNAYLQFAKGEGAEQVEHIEMVSFIKDVALPFSSNQFKIDFETEKEELFIFIRPVAFRRCLSNVFDNTKKYSEKALVRITSDDENIIICIDDDGPGITEELREDVFKPFFREDSARNLKEGGVGLGLSIARDIVLAHGGAIELDQAEMGGLSVRIELPF